MNRRGFLGLLACVGAVKAAWGALCPEPKVAISPDGKYWNADGPVTTTDVEKAYTRWMEQNAEWVPKEFRWVQGDGDAANVEIVI